MTEVVYHPGEMPAAELAHFMQSSNRRLYAWPVLVRKAIGTLFRTHNPMAAMFAWSSNLNYRRVDWNNSFQWELRTAYKLPRRDLYY